MAVVSPDYFWSSVVEDAVFDCSLGVVAQDVVLEPETYSSVDCFVMEILESEVKA